VDKRRVMGKKIYLDLKDNQEEIKDKEECKLNFNNSKEINYNKLIYWRELIC